LHEKRGKLARVGDPPPEVVQDQQRPGGLQLLGQRAQAEHHRVAIRPGGGGPVEQAPVGAGDERGKPAGELEGRRVAVAPSAAARSET
jgi:hypothetical protein